MRKKKYIRNCLKYIWLTNLFQIDLLKEYNASRRARKRRYIESRQFVF